MLKVGDLVEVVGQVYNGKLGQVIAVTHSAHYDYLVRLEDKRYPVEAKFASYELHALPSVPEAPAPVAPKPSGWRMQYDNSSQRRKEQPVAEGFLDYFPAAARLVAELSRLGNEKHNPGEPMHHARGKSKDHRNCITRHVMDADKIDPETELAEAVCVVWRAAAYLQELAERKYGWPLAPGAKE